MNTKRDIKSLSHEELEKLVCTLGYPKYRVQQIEEWLYHRECDSISNMDNIPAKLRSELESRLSLTPLELVTKRVSEDGTRKYLFQLEDGVLVEAVGIPSSDGTRLTACFSSQAGCPMGCSFCATGKSGFSRNLHSGEMYDQVRYVSDDFGRRVSNAVCMGQGEPFLNYDNVLEALRRMNAKSGLGIGARHITVSTCGIADGINRLSHEPEQFTLAISLHAAIQETRNSLMPGVSTTTLEELRLATEGYIENTHRRPTFEYAPLKGINDDAEHIDALVSFCRGLNCHVNLIPFNDIGDEAPFIPSPHITAIASLLQNSGVECSIRASKGSDIDGACGQLRRQYDKSLSTN